MMKENTNEKIVQNLKRIIFLTEDILKKIVAKEVLVRPATLKRANHTNRTTEISFNMNLRAFMHQHARSLNGIQKFVLLLAWLVKGNHLQEVSSGEIEKHWNRMKSILGGEFNRAHANRAKTKGWVDSPKRGMYKLSQTWKEVL